MNENELEVSIFTQLGAKVPTRATEYSAGWDLYANDAVVLGSNTTAIISTGVYLAIQSGWEAQVRSRSGLAAKENIFVLNSPGTIDADYRGEVKVILRNCDDYEKTIKRGDRIAQLVFARVPKVSWNVVEQIGDLPQTVRGQGGFGSSGA